MENKRVLSACKLAAFLYSLCTNILAPLLVSIGREFGIGLQKSGGMFLAFFAGNFAACTVSGWLVGRFGKVIVFYGSLVCMTVLCGIIGAAPSFWAVCTALFLLGFATLIMQVTAVSIPADIAVGDTASAVSGVQAFCGFGALAGLLWSGIVLALGVSWRMSYLSFAAVSLAATIYILGVKFPVLPCSGSGGFREMRGLLKNKSFQPTFLCLFLYAGAETAICSWLVTYLTESLGFASLEASAVTGTIWGGVFVGRLVCAKLTRRIRPAVIVMSMIPISAACVLAIVHLQGPAVCVAAVVLGLSMSGIWPLTASKLVDDERYDSGTTISIAFLFSYIGNSLVPYMIGAIGERVGLAAAITADGLILCLLFLVFSLSQTAIRQRIFGGSVQLEKEG
ncbi:MFS transporter [Ruminococcus sp. OA3]|uniref:MFS transporter n=1 Tax=Ruminococcus sp. OA3 TaxID=2914164 RepID=UPI001F06E57A|nr:MFS transporter [Ruminococcus sp. OA3]MCH1982014.1 MFS transporter [Ruminococcus sp. OA3]